jgi:hypothetical protein
MVTEVARLPEQMSELLQLALDDLAKAERSKRYTVSMGSWHVYDPGTDTCFVCLAGAVMARTLKEPRKRYCTSEDFEGATGYCLHALDYLRMGYIREAYAARYGEGGVRPDGLPEGIEIPPYETRRKEWWARMRQLVKMLREAGD